MQAIYPHWLSSFKDSKQVALSKQSWRRVLANLGMDEIRAGLDACLFFEDFPPSPARFIKLALNLVDYDQANDKHPLKDRAKVKDRWILGHSTAKEVEKIERNNYLSLINQVIEERFEIEEKEEENEQFLLEEK
jgi:hypothetical protein